MRMSLEASVERLSDLLALEPARVGGPAFCMRPAGDLLYGKCSCWRRYCREVDFLAELPCETSSLTRLRQRLGKAGVEDLLAAATGAAEAEGIHLRHSWVRSFPDTFYDDEAVVEHLKQTEILASIRPATTIVDLGYLVREAHGDTVIHRGKAKTLTRSQENLLKPRRTVEPTVVHLKDRHHLRRHHLKGELANAVPSTLVAGCTLRCLARLTFAFRDRMLAALQSIALPISAAMSPEPAS